jgi:hypothetical protein
MMLAANARHRDRRSLGRFALDLHKPHRRPSAAPHKCPLHLLHSSSAATQTASQRMAECLQPKRRVKLGRKPSLLRIVGAVTFPASVNGARLTLIVAAGSNPFPAA